MKVFLQRILIVFPGILGGVLALFLLPFSGFLERVWWDWAVAARLRVGQAAYREVTPRFVLVEIDEASIQDEKKWPLDRKEYARLLDVLDSGDARVVVFDLIFSEPSNPESDRVFAKALSRKTNRYLAFHHTVQGRAGEPTWRDVSRETAVFQPIFPYEPFRKAAREKLGFADVVPDPDGTVRKASLFRLNENKSLPSLGIVVAHGLFDYPLSDPSECVLGKYCLGPLRIPMEPGGQAGLGIGFYPGEINHISISRALGFSKGEAAEYFRDKIIFVAATAEGIRDTVTLPVLGTVPGVFLHIQFLAQILARQFFRPLLPGWTASLLLVLTGVSLGVAFLRLPLFKAVLLLLATATAIWGASAGLLIFCGGVLSPVGLLLAITLTFLCATIWRTFSAEIHGRRAGSLPPVSSAPGGRTSPFRENGRSAHKGISRIGPFLRYPRIHCIVRAAHRLGNDGGCGHIPQGHGSHFCKTRRDCIGLSRGCGNGHFRRSSDKRQPCLASGPCGC
ncbi:MAG: CHASE2 domain-containing protein [Armatimonadetes bacterium]|nr:CHASE2 domain-containing protein [Armatimonadota bacterium]